MKRHLITQGFLLTMLLLIIILAGCVPPMDTARKEGKPAAEGVEGAGPEAKEAEEKPQDAQEVEGYETEAEAKPQLPKGVKVAFAYTPDENLRGGMPNRFVWMVKNANGDSVDLTRLEASASEDFQNIAFKTPPQSGDFGSFNDILMFTKSTDGKYYVRAMAQVGGANYYSNAEEFLVVPTVLPSKSTTTIKTESGASKTVKQIDVKIKNSAFIPELIQASLNDIVIFTNDDLLSHSVTIEELGYDESMRKGESVQLQANKTGTFQVRDTIGYAKAVLKVSS